MGYREVRRLRIEEGARSKHRPAKTIMGSMDGTGAGHFRAALAEVTAESREPVEIEAMLERVNRAGRELIKGRGVAELKAYREAVREFLKNSVRSSYHVKSERRWDRQGNPRDYRIVAEVNRHLEELTRMVLENQAPSLQILAKLDEIRGLLVDLWV